MRFAPHSEQLWEDLAKPVDNAEVVAGVKNHDACSDVISLVRRAMPESRRAFYDRDGDLRDSRRASSRSILTTNVADEYWQLDPSRKVSGSYLRTALVRSRWGLSDLEYSILRVGWQL
jgi:hypothetical protein